MQRVEHNYKNETVDLILGDKTEEIHPFGLLKERLESLNLKDAYKLA